MSLLKKLSIHFTFLVLTILMIFGMLVYFLVNFILIDQVDQRLISTSTQIIGQLTVSQNNLIDPRRLAEFSAGESQFFQVWRNQSELVYSRPFNETLPLDPVGLQEGHPVFRNIARDDGRIRVLSVPLETARGPNGVLQIAVSLNFLDTAVTTLGFVLILILSISVFLSVLSIRILAKQTVFPLVSVTESAKQITEMNDLSRRIPIPYQGSEEIIQLIFSFNETLERLDNLFTSQKRLLADVSHELRTPLTVIKGEVGLIRKYRQIDEDSISAIEAEVDRLTRLVGNLLMISQAESGELPMDFKPFSLDDLVCEVYQHMKTLAADRISICLEKVDQVLIIGDRDRIKQVLLNLTGNAIQYSRDGDRVCIKLEIEAEEILLSVEDSGPGIPKEDLKHIFDRFYRGERSRSRTKSSGFGLGLSISQYIIEKHNGYIDVVSEKDEGTRFTIHLPIAK